MKLLELKLGVFTERHYTQYHIMNYLCDSSHIVRNGYVYRFFKKMVSLECINKEKDNRYSIDRSAILNLFEEATFTDGLTWKQFVDKMWLKHQFSG